MSDVKRVARMSDPALAPFNLVRWRRRFEELEARLVRELEQEGLQTDEVRLRLFAELQFRGQVHSVRVPLSEQDLAVDDGGEQVIERFITMYEAKYGQGTAYPEAGVEAMSFGMEGTASLPLPQSKPLPQVGRTWAWREEAGGPFTFAIKEGGSTCRCSMRSACFQATSSKGLLSSTRKTPRCSSILGIGYGLMTSLTFGWNSVRDGVGSQSGTWRWLAA